MEAAIAEVALFAPSHLRPKLWGGADGGGVPGAEICPPAAASAAPPPYNRILSWHEAFPLHGNSPLFCSNLFTWKFVESNILVLVP